jgi:ABC-2 type transport system ATP-binding protein
VSPPGAPGRSEPPTAGPSSPSAPGEPGVAVLRCEGLRKRFGARQEVDGISFEIARGETYGLLGPNGAGKTTTISMVCGILARDGGTVVVDGRPLDVGTTSAKAAIGLVPQDLAIYPDLTARENLVFFGRLYGMGGRDLAARVDEVLDVVDLADRAKERTEHYSGGMKRRLNIAVGLLHRPRLLVLDEPTVGVDPQSRNAILSSVEALSAQGMGILYTTHYMEEAERLCARVGIIDEGRIIAEGTRRELVALVGGLDKFNVSWANPVATAAIIVVFSFVAGGAAMLIGEIAANASQAGAIGPALGMLLGLLGGTMVPAEVFPEAMRTASHLTPHAWAMDAFRGLLLRGETLVDILPQLAVLAGFAVVLMTLAVWRFRRALVAG